MSDFNEGLRSPRLSAALALLAAVSASVMMLASGCGEGSVPEATAESTDSGTVSASGLPRLMDLGSDSCIPCQMMAPELEALAQEYAGVLEVVVIDVYDDPATADKYDIMAIPTEIFFSPQGTELERHMGFMAKEDMVARFEELGYPLVPTASP